MKSDSSLETDIVFDIIKRMASLRVLNEQPDSITLGKGGARGAGNFIGLIIFAVIACVGLSAIFGEGGQIDPVMIVIGLIVGFVLVVSLFGALRSTRVVVDRNQNIASRTNTFLGVPINRQELAFNLIRDVQVTTPTGNSPAQTKASIWQLQLRGTDGSKLVVNDRGARGEMTALAQRVGAIVNRPVRTGNEPSVAPASPYAPTVVLGSLVQNLGAFAQSVSDEAKMSVEARMAGAPFARTSAQQTMEQTAADATILAASARIAEEQADVFESDARVQAQMQEEQRAAGTPFMQSSAHLAVQQAEGEYATPYAVPDTLTMPVMPGLMSFAPAMDLPAMPPLGTAMAALGVSTVTPPEIKYVSSEIETVDTTGETGRGSSAENLNAQYRAARQQHAARNFKSAGEAYKRALDFDPSNTAVLNDLGVLYFHQNKIPDAERAFRQTLALDPFFMSARYNLGLTLQRQGKRKQAQEAFRLGARDALPGEQSDFQNALQGNMHAPIFSP